MEAEAASPVFWVFSASIVALVALWMLVLRDAWRAWQPARLLLSGRYPEAAAAAQKLERSWMSRVFKSVRVSTHYATACALHLQGELEQSIEAIGKLRRDNVAAKTKLDGNMQYAVCSIEAASLVLLDRDPKRVVELLQEAARVHRPPEDLLLMALAKHTLGEKKEAKALFDEAGEKRVRTSLRLGNVLLIENEEQQEAIFHTLRGLYLLKAESNSAAAAAAREFSRAAKGTIKSVYVDRARKELSRSTTTIEPTTDARSSLAPQVVSSVLGPPVLQEEEEEEDPGNK